MLLIVSYLSHFIELSELHLSANIPTLAGISWVFYFLDNLSFELGILLPDEVILVLELMLVLFRLFDLLSELLNTHRHFIFPDLEGLLLRIVLPQVLPEPREDLLH